MKLKRWMICSLLLIGELLLTAAANAEVPIEASGDQRWNRQFSMANLDTLPRDMVLDTSVMFPSNAKTVFITGLNFWDETNPAGGWGPTAMNDAPSGAWFFVKQDSVILFSISAQGNTTTGSVFPIYLPPVATLPIDISDKADSMDIVIELYSAEPTYNKGVIQATGVWLDRVKTMVEVKN